MYRKAIIFLPDGMADDQLPELNGKTPLEYAHTPGMDKIASSGLNGTFRTLPDGLPTSSDVANMSVLGFQPELNYPGRGPIEAASQNIQLADDDVAWRCNLVYASDDGILRDYSAGHISAEDAAIFMQDLKKEFDSPEVTFHSGVSYRNLLVLHGKRFSPEIDYHKPDSSQDLPVSSLRLTPANDSREAADTVKFLIDLEERAAKFLAAHPLNAGRPSPANRIWPWSPGRHPQMELFSQRYNGRTGAVISAVDVIKGLGKCSGMEVIEVPGATGYLDTNYEGKVAAALEAIEKFDLVYLHVEAIDECSHQGDLQLKLKAITDFDAKIVSPVLKALEGRDINFAVLPDHPTPVAHRTHTAEPVPFLISAPSLEPDAVVAFDEEACQKGAYGLLEKDGFIRAFMAVQ